MKNPFDIVSSYAWPCNYDFYIFQNNPPYKVEYTFAEKN